MSDEDKLDKILAGLGIMQKSIDKLTKRVDAIEKEDVPTTTKKKRSRPTKKKSTRPNLFEESEDFNAHKDDVEIDEKLTKGKTPTPRGVRSSGVIDIECSLCGKIVKAHKSTIPKETQRFKCDRCICRRK